MEEEIIKAVRPHLVLYDTNHSDYMKSKLKEDIWSAIAKDLDLSNGMKTTYSECKRCKKKT
jgi:hypothetical protein